MNYIEQIKGFWIAQEVNQLGSSEIAMYFYLLEIWNKTGWVGTFHRNNYKVMGDLSIKSYKTLQSIRDRLQASGIIVYKGKIGDANVEYTMTDLGKFYRGSGRGSGVGCGRGSGVGDGIGSGVYNINQTKPNQTKQSKSHSGAKAPDRKKIELPYWKNFIEEWNSWYEKTIGCKYMYLDKDFAHLKKIYKFLEKRAEEKKFEFTEDNLLAAFRFFLQKAWDKDSWLRNNFSIPNILSQFNQIVNEQRKTDSKAKQPTGANVSTGSILQKINAMPD